MYRLHTETGEEKFLSAMENILGFYNRMCAFQHESGGFGPEEWCVP